MLAMEKGGFMSEHTKKVCLCGKVLVQCRCIGPHKIELTEICEHQKLTKDQMEKLGLLTKLCIACQQPMKAVYDPIAKAYTGHIFHCDNCMADGVNMLIG